ncbi:uncharacterized protein DC041_0005641, partial [Schistosoma bovis]
FNICFSSPPIACIVLLELGLSSFIPVRGCYIRRYFLIRLYLNSMVLKPYDKSEIDNERLLSVASCIIRGKSIRGA